MPLAAVALWYDCKQWRNLCVRLPFTIVQRACETCLLQQLCCALLGLVAARDRAAKYDWGFSVCIANRTFRNR